MEVVRNYMEERCASDPILAIKYANPAKSLEKALKVQKSGLTIMDSDSVFSLILHYYDENLEDVPNVYYDEGSRQHICVGSSSYYLKENTLVFTAKIKDKTIATIEISLKDYSFIQCRAFANKVCQYQDLIAKIISDNIKMIAERKRA